MDSFDQDRTNLISAVSEIFKDDHKETVSCKIRFWLKKDCYSGLNYEGQNIRNSTNRASNHFYHGIKLSLASIIALLSKLQKFKAVRNGEKCIHVRCRNAEGMMMKRKSFLRKGQLLLHKELEQMERKDYGP